MSVGYDKLREAVDKDCRLGGGDTKCKDMWRQECESFIVTNEEAERRRRKMRLIAGGRE